MKFKNKRQRACSRTRGKELTVSRAVKIAQGLKEYNTRKFPRDKSWKLYRRTQYVPK